jgi:hypothetical protein
MKSVDTKLKTGIAESLREPLRKIAQHLLISDKNTLETVNTYGETIVVNF